MSLELVATEDMTIDLSNTVDPGDLVYIGPIDIADPAVTAITSTKCKAEGKGICTTSLTFVFAIAGKPCPHTSALYDFVAGGGVVMASAVKCKAEGQLVMREGDEDSLPLGVGCVGTWKLKANPFTVAPCGCGIDISDAGQTKVKAQ